MKVAPQSLSPQPRLLWSPKGARRETRPSHDDDARAITMTSSASASPLDLPVVLYEIFRHCNARTLARASCVNRLWRETARRVTSNAVRAFSTHFTARSTYAECLLDVASHIDTLQRAPAALLLFISQNDDDYDVDVVTSFCRRIPSNCIAMFCDNERVGVIGKDGRVFESDDKQPVVVTTLVIPRLNNMSVQLLGLNVFESPEKFTENAIRSLFASSNDRSRQRPEQEVVNLFPGGVIDYESSRLVLCLTSCESQHSPGISQPFYRGILRFRRRHGNALSSALVGGTVIGSSRCYVGATEIPYPNSSRLGLALGGVGFRSATVVSRDVRDVRDLMARVRRDLGGGASTLRSAACFACISVGRRDDVVPGSSSDPLHSMRALFPGVPVVGFLGNDEFGELGACGYEDEAGAGGGDSDGDDQEDQERSKKRKRVEAFQHAFTFAFGFLTLPS